MTLFPLLAATVTVLVDGLAMRSYASVFEAGGHIFVPVRPYVLRVADHTWYEGDRLAIEREGRTVFVRVRPQQPDALDGAFVPLRSVMRALGLGVTYNSTNRAVDIHIPSRAMLTSPTPYDSSLPQSSPSVVFTPEPVPTPRPVWEGPALPRRTPIPYTAPTPTPTP